MTQTGIRPYGPGKFNTMLDAYVYGVSLEGGCDDESDDSSISAWSGMMRHGSTIFQDHDPFTESLTEAERDKLTACAGVILTEDSQGFVYVDYYDTEAALDRDWTEIRAREEIDTDEVQR